MVTGGRYRGGGYHVCRGVMRPYPHPRSAEYITGLAAM